MTFQGPESQVRVGGEIEGVGWVVGREEGARRGMGILVVAVGRMVGWVWSVVEYRALVGLVAI